MKKILVLGGGGLLGHKACMVLSKEFDVFATFRKFDAKLREKKIIDESKVITGVDAFDFENIQRIIKELKPGIVLNCIGIIKQLKEAKDPRISIYINSLLPHLLADACDEMDSKLIHISTDCVFSGRKGDYKEEDISDAEDLYGRTKYLGEVKEGNSLTLRTSIIGHELFSAHSLVDWFLSQEGGKVNGYVNAIFTGFPTIVLCNEISRIIKDHAELKGLNNISSDKINKFDLLKIIKKVYGANIEIEPYEDFYCDRSLDSAKYRTATGFHPASWETMIMQMHEDHVNNNNLNI